VITASVTVTRALEKGFVPNVNVFWTAAFTHSTYEMLNMHSLYTTVY